MSSQKIAGTAVRSAFPGHERAIDRGLRDHPSFRELCEDYRRCASALERWRTLDGEGPSARTREYEGLLAELGSEVETWFEVLEKETNGADGAGSR